jgi:hypothetical protein
MDSTGLKIKPLGLMEGSEEFIPSNARCSAQFLEQFHKNSGSPKVAGRQDIQAHATRNKTCGKKGERQTLPKVQRKMCTGEK